MVMIELLELLDPCRRVRLMLGDYPNTLVYELTPTNRQRTPASRRLGCVTNPFIFYDCDTGLMQPQFGH